MPLQHTAHNVGTCLGDPQQRPGRPMRTPAPLLPIPEGLHIDPQDSRELCLRGVKLRSDLAYVDGLEFENR